MKIKTKTYQFTNSLKETATRLYTRNQSKLQNKYSLTTEFKKLLQPTRNYETL